VSDVADVRVFFTAEQSNFASDVMRQSFSGYGSVAQGYVFDTVEYTGDHRLARLTRGGKVFHVPTTNILMVVGNVEDE
jgi:hypothetical protein